MSTIYASFADPAEGKKAVGALLDHGVLKDDLSLVVREDADRKAEAPDPDTLAHVDETPKFGITTTTGADAGLGALKGAGAGAVLGALGALACLVIPGFGIVIGGGALATAIVTAIGTTAAGATVGGLTGYLKDQGIPESEATQAEATLHSGGAILAVHAPAGPLDRAAIEGILMKYHATFHNLYENVAMASAAMDRAN